MGSKTSDLVLDFDKIGNKYLNTIERVTILFGSDALRLAHTKPTTKMIDIGCGSGGVAIHATNLGIDVVATDISQNMLEIINMRNPQIKTIQSDGQTLEGIQSDQFDCACSIFGVFLFPDRMAGWKSALRVLKPGGVFVATSWDSSKGEDMVYRFNSIPAFLPEDKKPLPYRNGVDFRETIPLFQLQDKNLFKKELEASGFRDVQIFTLTHSVVFKTRDELMDSFLRLNDKLSEAYDSLSGEERQQCRDRYFKAFGDDNQSGPIVVPAIAHVAVAKK
eukprot:TRINITY_DN6026_c0_g1_i4.p2 TRINITY_DN6026_c0_g1~~TRINITY_DN6026_c0_g1_i4.p2  ORF type:complete len:277 (+),score=48.66 TRINITY_DN6026_c0_g1_i4:142-972(+)